MVSLIGILVFMTLSKGFVFERHGEVEGVEGSGREQGCVEGKRPWLGWLRAGTRAYTKHWLMCILL